MLGKLTLFSLLIASFGLTSALALPSPADLLHFDTSDDIDLVFKGSAMIANQENPSLKLNGIGDYLILDSSLPKKLNDFSISVWVKPDFKVGAPATLSIVSESHAFDLSINNDQIDENIATFSVYDGIKWHQVDSKSEIKDTWTHLAATYSDETISIFVNGVKENSSKVDGGYSLTYTFGMATQNSNDHIKSESRVLIGAFSPLVRADGVVKNNFSGLIDNIELYAISLSPTNISEIYNKNRISTVNTLLIQKPVLKETGTPNEFGFVASKNILNNQKIESYASPGYKLSKQGGGIVDGINYSEIQDEVNNDSINVEYYSPVKPEHEKTVSIGNSIKKLVRVDSGSVITFSELPATDSGISYTWNLYGLESGTLVDHSNNPEVYFNLIDSNSDGTLDRAEWVVINDVKDFYLISEVL